MREGKEEDIHIEHKGYETLGTFVELPWFEG